MKKYAYFNNKIIPEDDIIISHHDLGFLRGYGIMDAMRTIKGRPFLLKEHFERLDDGVKTLNIKWGLDLKKFTKIIKRLLEKNNFINDVAIKTIVTGGVSSNGLKIDKEPTILITINNLEGVSPSEDDYSKGVGVISAEFQRFMPETKTTNYIFALQHQVQKEKFKANEIIYKNKGKVLEGATSNIFIIKDGKILTPSKNILMGTTRNFLINILKKEGFEVEGRIIKFEELLRADEIFLTGTFKNILPVIKVDDIIIGSGKVGEITNNIINLFSDYSSTIK